MKKPFQKIISTIFLLLIATVMTGTSTFAWFSMNNVVTASTMRIRATSSSPYLVISNKEDGIFATSTNSMILSPAHDEEDEELEPVLALTTPLNLGEFENAAGVQWGTATSDDPDDANVEAETTVIDADELYQYVQISELWFKVLAPDQRGRHLKITKVTFDKGSSTIAESGRVLAVSESGNYQLFKLVPDAEGGVVLSAEEGSDGFLVDTVDTTPLMVTLFFYFDGTDESTYTNNAGDLSGISATFEFRVD